MSKQTINIGTSPNSGTGDPLRTAFTKVNENFTEVYTTAQAAYDTANTNSLGNFKISGSALGTTAEGDGWGAYDMYLSPNGEGNAYITIPNDTSVTESGASLVLANYSADGGGIDINSNVYHWKFKPDGTVEFPSNALNFGDAGADLKSSSYAELWFAATEENWTLDPEINSESYVYVNANGIGFDNYRPTNGEDATWSRHWQFNNDGSTTFPTLTVPISDNINPSGTGQTLKFSDVTQQAIIYGPSSTPEVVNAERIIIQGAPGYTGTAGEGGDVYLWAGPGGDTDGQGGDIKVRAGQGFGTGTGGYLNFQAGDSQTGSGGYINIESGSGNFGGDISMYARNGGDIDITVVDAGEIGIHADGSSWYFSLGGYVSYPSDTLKYDGDTFAISTRNDIPSSISAVTGSSGSWESNPVSDLATTGGTGTGLTVDISDYESGYAGTITIHTPGSGYLDGDEITVTSGTSSATFVISVPANIFTLSGGNLTFPDTSVQTGAAISRAELKVLVAASTDFADFQTRIAAL